MNKKEKPKEFNVSGILLSELSFVDQQKRGAMEIYGFWGYRVEEVQNRIKESLGLKPLEEYNVDFNRVYSTGKVFATKIEKPKVVEDKNAEPKLQEKQK